MESKIDDSLSEQSLNKHLSPLFEITLFIIGFFGLSLVGYLFESIFTAIGMDSTQISTKSLINFSTYLALTICSIAVLGPVGLRVLKKQFKNLSNLQNGVMFAAFLIIGSMIISNICTNIGIELGIDMTVNDNENLIRLSVKENPILAFFFVVVFAPFTEELAYRVGFFGLLKKKTNKYLAFVISSLFFAFIHFNFFAKGDKLIIELLNLPSYLYAGFMLSFAYNYRDSLVSSWTAHLINNLLSFIIISTSK